MLENKKIKIGYFADGPWSHRAFELLISDNEIEVAFIVPRTDSSDETLLHFAIQYKIPLLKGVSVNSDAFYDLAISYECDLFVSMSFNQIFKKRIIELPPHGTINCHAGKLPYYRGRNILNWALINDETEFGITVHYIDEGIDTGDILLQKIFTISHEDDYSTLLNIAHTECASILYASIKQLQLGQSTRIKQDQIDPVGFYCGMRIKGDEIINWEQTSRQLFNFIRAVCEPGPRAHTTLNGHVIKINKAKLIKGAPHYIGIAGQIVGQTDDGFVVKSLDSTLEIFGIESQCKLKIGDRLGT